MLQPLKTRHLRGSWRVPGRCIAEPRLLSDGDSGHDARPADAAMSIGTVLGGAASLSGI
jgi:hypothetical protein